MATRRGPGTVKMRVTIWLALLLLSGCGSQEKDEFGEAEAPAPPGAETAAGDAAQADGAALQERVDRAMAGVLQDPRGARYRNLRPGLAGSLCGEVDPKQTDGRRAGFRPFLVTAQGAARIAAAPRLTFDDPTDSFPDFYIRWCASPEELKALEPALRQAIARSAAAGNPAPLPDAAIDPLIEEPAPDPPAEEPAPAADAKPGDVESFYKSVRRKTREK